MSATNPTLPPPVPVALRLIAAWLESHPAAEVDGIDFLSAPPVRANRYVIGGRDETFTTANLIGHRGPWRTERRHSRWGLAQQIAPGVDYRLIATQPVPDDES